MFNIIKVQPVGDRVMVYAVITTNEDTHSNLEYHLTEYFVAEYGEGVSIEYTNQFAVDDVSAKYLGIDRMLNLDNVLDRM